MKTKEDYEDVWQKARFNQEIIYKNISGKPIQESKKSYAREICLTIHHRVQKGINEESTTHQVSTSNTQQENQDTKRNKETSQNIESTKDTQKKVTENSN
tara:strand:- start:1322 stop:1621 length:300 start_codon:yes stop_codon:yes gene_type:complete